MKVLFICNLFSPNERGGYEILCKKVVENFHRLGLCVEVLTSHSNDKKIFDYPVHYDLKLITAFNQECSNSRLRRYYIDQYNYNSTKNLIKKMQPDLVFIWSQLRLGIGAARCAEELCNSVAYTFNDNHILNYLPRDFKWTLKSLFSHLLDNFFLQKYTTSSLKFDRVVCISEYIQKDLEKVFNKKSNSRIIYQGVELDKFSGVNSDSSFLRLVYTGQIHRYKGVHTIFEALKTLQERFRQLNITLTICGDGDDNYLQELKSHARDLSVSCKFTGRVDHGEISKILKDSDVLIFPSIWSEPFGLSHLEAMASNVVVVSTNTGGCSEFLKDNENCLVFKEDSPKDLANSLLVLLNNKELYQTLRDGGKSTVREDFSFKRYISDLLEYLNTRRDHEGYSYS